MLQHLLVLILLSLSFLPSFAQEEGYAKAADHKIHYYKYGQKGTPIVIINGGPGMNCEGFKSLAKTLANKGYCSIIYDQRGTGKSTIVDPNTNNIRMDLMVDDLEALRTHLQLDSWVVMGQSFGGMLASYYATKHPYKIKGLILSASGGIDLGLFDDLNIQGRLTDAERDSLAYWTAKINMSGDSSYYAHYRRGLALAPAYLYNKKHVPIIAERLTQSNMEINRLVFQDLRRIEFNCADPLSNFKPPVLIIQGKQDIIGEKIAYKAANIFPNDTIVFMDKCGHYGWLDSPKIYFKSIKRFMDLVE